jgi:hypothetical protein
MASTPVKRLFAKKESGVALIIPITSGLSTTSILPLQFSVNIRLLFAIFGDKDREGVVDN